MTDDRDRNQSKDGEAAPQPVRERTGGAPNADAIGQVRGDEVKRSSDPPRRSREQGSE